MFDKYFKFWPVVEAVASMSKDPSTKIGCVILSPDYNILATGYNGLPRKVDDTIERLSDRATKLAFTVHGESNAIAMAARQGHKLEGSTALISSLFPCSRCAGLLIQAGVIRVISPPWDVSERWREEGKIARMMFQEAGVEILTHPNDSF